MAIPIIIGGIMAGANLGARALTVANQVADSLPKYEEVIVCSVLGNSNSNKRAMFKRALAICFGQSSQLNGFMVPGNITVGYDMMAKTVQVSLSYQYADVINKIVNGGGAKFRDQLLSSVDEDIRSGDYNQGGWFFNGLPFANNKPALPTAGTLMAAGTPTSVKANSGTNSTQVVPKFSGSAGTFAQNLFYAALSNPKNITQAYSSAEYNRQKSANQFITTPRENTFGVSQQDNFNNQPQQGQPTSTSNSLVDGVISGLVGAVAGAIVPPLNSNQVSPSTEARNIGS